jgi:hypothetical protein
MKYKVGDNVIIANEKNHHFDIGLEVEITEIFEPHYKTVNGDIYQWITDENISGYSNKPQFTTDISKAILFYCDNKEVNLSTDRISDFIGHAKRLDLEELASELEDLKNLIK